MPCADVLVDVPATLTINDYGFLGCTTTCFHICNTVPYDQVAGIPVTFWLNYTASADGYADIGIRFENRGNVYTVTRRVLALAGTREISIANTLGVMYTQGETYNIQNVMMVPSA